MAPEKSSAPRALVVDDDPSIVEFVAAVLESAGWQVERAATGNDALSAAHRFRPQVILLDITIPQQSGWLVCAKLKLVSDTPSIIFMTGLSGRQVAQYATQVGADGLLRKPFSPQEILRTLNRVASASKPAAPAPA